MKTSHITAAILAFTPLLAAAQADFPQDKPWFEEHRQMIEDSIRVPLTDLSNHLGDADWLDDAFSAGLPRL